MANEPKGTVLIVEDEEELRFILTVHLRAVNFDVMEASDGAKAIEMAVERQPDVIIMDIGLPVVDGITATRTLKADPRTMNIPIIMLTARSGASNIVKGLDAGAQEYLPKPFDVAELLARVHTVHRLAATTKDLDRLNTRLEAEVDVKTKRLRVLYEFMRDLNHADSRDQIFDLLIRCVEQATNAGRISLFIADHTGEHLVCERAVGMEASSLDPIRMKDQKGITGQVIRSGKTLSAKTYGVGAGRDRDYVQDVFLSTPLVSTSLSTREGVIGIINVTEKTDDSPFSEEQIECIRSVADATAIALANVDRQNRLQESVRVLVQTVGNLAEYRDEETTLHLERVTMLARILAKELQREGPYKQQVTDGFVQMLVHAAPMHDIGKVGISDDILTKPGKLTEEEFQIMKTHTDIGRRVLSRAMDASGRVPLLEMCVDIAHCHHEKFDGTGYPRRLSGQDIPLAARIIALVDAYDAITSQRRYKDALSHEEAVQIIRDEAGHHFDAALTEAFLRIADRFDEVRARYEESLEVLNTVPA